MFSSTLSAPASAGVTEGQRRSCWAMVRASVIACQVSIPQKLVDAGLGAGALVDALDDHGAGGGGPGLAVLQRAARQGTRHHHGIFRDLAYKSFAGVAIDDLGGGAEEYAHRQHRALAHDDA